MAVAGHFHWLEAKQSAPKPLTAAERRAARSALDALDPPPSYRRERPCHWEIGICYRSKQLLHPMTPSAALRLVASFGFPSRALTPGLCRPNPLNGLGPHPENRSLSCAGVAPLGPAEVVFFVTSVYSPSPKMAPAVGTGVEISVVGRRFKDLRADPKKP